MAKSNDKNRVSDKAHLRLQQELHAVKRQLGIRCRKKLRFDRQSLDLAEQILQLEERKEDLDQLVYKERNLVSKGGTRLHGQETGIETSTAPELATPIAPDYQTPPVTLLRMAALMGGDMTRHKLRMMINRGTYSAIQLNRQSWIFNTQQLPQRIVKEIRERKKKTDTT